eukprot:GHVS01100897.1.p1 GENE.GHVS01100897.1~~GHVS01100897.1.p1  ORF type:complete len:623 (+),score=70.15 GHVS01100897.1:289-2157(+)
MARKRGDSSGIRRRTDNTVGSNDGSGLPSTSTRMVQVYPPDSTQSSSPITPHDLASWPPQQASPNSTSFNCSSGPAFGTTSAAVSLLCVAPPNGAAFSGVPPTRGGRGARGKRGGGENVGKRRGSSRLSHTTGREGGKSRGCNTEQMSTKANGGTKDGPSRLSEEFASGYLYGRVIRLVSRAASSQHDHPGTAIENNNDGYIVKVSRLPDGTSPTGNVNTTLKLRQSSFANWKVGPFVDDIVKVKFLRNDDQLFRERKTIPSKFTFAMLFLHKPGNNVSAQDVLTKLNTMTTNAEWSVLRLREFQYFTEVLQQLCQWDNTQVMDFNVLRSADENSLHEEFLKLCLRLCVDAVAAGGTGLSCRLHKKSIGGKTTESTIQLDPCEQLLIDAIECGYFSKAFPECIAAFKRQHHNVPVVAVVLVDWFLHLFPLQLHLFLKGLQAVVDALSSSKLRVLLDTVASALRYGYNKATPNLKYLSLGKRGAVEIFDQSGFNKRVSGALASVRGESNFIEARDIPLTPQEVLQTNKVFKVDGLPVVKTMYETMEDYLDTYFRLFHANCLIGMTRAMRACMHGEHIDPFALRKYMATPVAVCIANDDGCPCLEVECRKIGTTVKCNSFLQVR